jgi:predicted hotdog family 3-hydroxylacyl-ACP dehydratase
MPEAIADCRLPIADSGKPQHARLDRLADAPRQMRAGVAKGIEKGAESRVDRAGGMFKAGLIRGVSMCTHGEAIGHGYWLDRQFIASVVDGATAAEKGLKARFTHPGLSADGLGTFLGRFMNPRLSQDGRKAIADLHLSEAARKSPDGDLAEYVCTLADKDPEAFATSIVFEPDREAESDFALENGAELKDDGDGGRYVSMREFTSPDPDNAKQMPHARLKALRACDTVDDPAANPDGLFQREQQFAQEADALMSYAVGLADAAPAVAAFSGVHPDRVRGFVARFLDTHNLQIITKEKPVSTEAQETVQPATQASAEGQGEKTEPQGSSQEPVAGSPEEANPAAKTETPAEDVKPAEEAEKPAEEKPADPPAEEVPAEPAAPPPVSEQSAIGNRQSAIENGRAECGRFIAAFGAQGGAWFAEGLPFEEAQRKFTAAVLAENAELRKRLAGAGGGEKTPLSFQPTAEIPAGGKTAGLKLAGKIGENLSRVAEGIKIRRNEK